MNRTAVIYESKYGSTRRYAKWIAESLSCPAIERKSFKTQDFPQYDTIIYGGGLYAGSVSGIKFIAKNQDRLSGKKVILFTCGLTDPEDPDTITHIRSSLSNILPDDMLTRLRLFHLRGGIDYSRLNLLHRVMMAMLRRMLLEKEPDTLNGEEGLLLKTYGKCVDFTDRKAIQPLVDDCSSSF